MRRASLACVTGLVSVRGSLLRTCSRQFGASRSLCQALKEEQASKSTRSVQGDRTRENKAEDNRRLDTVELTFFGTSSGAPTSTRNQQGLGVRLGGETWLFDCGEATQHRMMETLVMPSQVRRIFISHLHGDHIFGLPGLLCRLATSLPVGSGDTLLQIVGPPGLRAFLRVVIGNSYATLKAGNDRLRLQIHELGGMSALKGSSSSKGSPAYSSQDMRPLPSEVEGELLLPDTDGSWPVPNPSGAAWSPMRGAACSLEPARHALRV